MKSILFIATSLALCSCASIVTGSSQSISVTSQPSAAECNLINDKGQWYVSRTPASVMVKRAYSNMTITCKKGEMEGSETVNSTTKGSAYGNILFGGVIGAGVDMSTGAAYDYPSNVNVKLRYVPL